MRLPHLSAALLFFASSCTLARSWTNQDERREPMIDPADFPMDPVEMLSVSFANEQARQRQEVREKKLGKEGRVVEGGVRDAIGSIGLSLLSMKQPSGGGSSVLETAGAVVGSQVATSGERKRM